MLKNYFKTAMRNIVRYKGFSIMNILGLSVGIACIVFISLWVLDELSYDNFYEDAEQIYRVNKKYKIGAEVDYNPSTPYPLAQTLKETIAEVEEATLLYTTSILVKYESKVLKERRAAYVSDSYFNVFSHKFLHGNPAEALNDPNDIVLSKEIAEKYFGTENAIGKILTVDNEKEYIVSGIIENIPRNTELRSKVFLPISSSIPARYVDNWGSHSFGTFVKLNKDADTDIVMQKFSNLLKEKLPDEDISLVVQPLQNLHLYTPGGEPVGMKYIYFFSAIALFILLIACINFMNLSTARSIRRAREVGMRKVVGANKRQLVFQFFGESYLYVILSAILALALVEFIRPAFNDLTGKQLDFSLLNFDYIIGFLIIVLITGFISGIYPALALSSFQPSKVLKGSVKHGKSGANFRKVLVVIQFSISIIVIIGSAIISSQLEFMKDRDLGFEKENIVFFSLNSEISKNYNSFRNRLLTNPNIINAARTSELPGEIWSIARGITWEGKEDDKGAAFGYLSVDFDYFDLMNLEFVDGRGYSRNFPADTSNYIFNEKAIEVMGYDDPVGKIFDPHGDAGAIVGVAKNFHALPLTYEIEPMMIIMQPGYLNNVLVKINGTDISSTINFIEKTWKEVSPNFPFEYSFLDERFEGVYRNELQAGKIFDFFLVLAIFISCLGLFGLASFMAEQKTKEIGIRKTLGASVAGLAYLLSKDFMKWVIAANIIAWPAAYFLMNNWLRDFAYRIEIQLWVFLFAGLSALVIAVLTVSYQSIKAALANPVDALKCE